MGCDVSRRYMGTLPLVLLALILGCNQGCESTPQQHRADPVVLNDSAMVVFQNAVVAQDTQRYALVIGLLDEAIDANPRYRNAYMNKAVVLHEVGRYANAIQVVETWLEMNPQDVHARMIRAILLSHNDQKRMAEEKLSEVLEIYDSKIKSHPDSIGLFADRAFVMLLLGHREQAVDVLDSLASIHPDSEKIRLMQTIFAEYGEEDIARLLFGM